MTILGSISSIGNVKSSVSSISISKNYQQSSNMGLNSIQCGGGSSNTGCGNPVGPIVGGLLITTGTIVGGVLNVLGGAVNGLLGGGGCN